MIKNILVFAAITLSSFSFASSGSTTRPVVKAGTSHSLHYEVDASNFKNKVVEASKTTPVLVEFYASWCGFCRKQGPMVEETVKEYNGAFKVARIDAEAFPTLADQHEVTTYPTTVLYKGGVRVYRADGILTKEELKLFLANKSIYPKNSNNKPMK